MFLDRITENRLVEIDSLTNKCKTPISNDGFCRSKISNKCFCTKFFIKNIFILLLSITTIKNECFFRATMQSRDEFLIRLCCLIDEDMISCGNLCPNNLIANNRWNKGNSLSIFFRISQFGWKKCRDTIVLCSSDKSLCCKTCDTIFCESIE